MLSYSSIVLVGNLNPAIFHPQWFERFKILPIQETQWAEGQKPEIDEIPYRDRKIIVEGVPPLIVAHDLADLRFPSLRIKVELGRYVCETVEREKFSLIRDVTLKVFNLLEHTPVSALGINFEGHWQFDDDRQSILKDLFAKQDEAFKDTLGDGYCIGGKIISEDTNRKMTLKIENSKVMENGVHFHANFHRDLKTEQAQQAVEMIKDYYDEDLKNIVRIAKRLLGEPKDTWKTQHK